jgi:Xaa-Pro aminopeptidase
MADTETPNQPEHTLRPMDRQHRLARTREAMAQAGAEALIVTKAVNLRWLCGFTGSNGLAVITPTELTVITDGRYRTQLADQLREANIAATQIIERQIEDPLRQCLSDVAVIALEADHVAWSTQRSFAQWLEPATLLPTAGLVETLRQHKDPGELDRLALAADIADRALAVLADRHGLDDPSRYGAGTTGPTEQDLARQLEALMFDFGADDRSFETIVAAGPNSALPHARPSVRPLTSGDLLIIDFGASVDGYGSDMTRTFRLGPVPAQADHLYAAVLESQAAGVAAVRDGIAQFDVDLACRSSLEAQGLGPAFVHGTGHGIGLEIHEEPFISTRSTGILRTNHVVTVEPGAYLPDFGGVRIEDSVVVTDTGCDPITRYPKPAAARP